MEVTVLIPPNPKGIGYPEHFYMKRRSSRNLCNLKHGIPPKINMIAGIIDFTHYYQDCRIAGYSVVKAWRQARAGYGPDKPWRFN